MSIIWSLVERLVSNCAKALVNWLVLIPNFWTLARFFPSRWYTTMELVDSHMKEIKR